MLNKRIKENFEYKKIENRFCSGSFPIHVLGTQGPYSAGIAATLSPFARDFSLVLTATDQEAEDMVQDLSLYKEDVYHFPSWGTMLYRGVSPQAAVFGRRVHALAECRTGRKSIVVASLRGAASLLPPPEYLLSRTLTLKKGQTIDPEKVAEELSRWGYLRVPRVSVAGEFALRGEVLDVYPPGRSEAIRVVLDFDEVEEIRLFDALNQSSVGKKEVITIYPVREVLWDEELIDHLERQLKELGMDSEEIIHELKTSGELRGEELFYPLCFDRNYTIFDYLGEKSAVYYVNTELLRNSGQALNQEYGELYKRSLNEGLIYPAPEKIMADPLALVDNPPSRTIHFHSLMPEELSREEVHSFQVSSGRSFFGNMNFFKEELASLVEGGFEIFIFAESDSQADRISFILKEFPVKIVSESISSGFSLPDERLICIQENEIFGRKKRVARSVKTAKSQVIDSFVDLNPGDYVVHVNYGIGKFLGIKRIKAAGNERDYISLEYQGEETVFIPIEQVNLVQRYIGSKGARPKLDKIGGSVWEKKRNRVKKKVEDIADKLIQLYASRQESSGYAYPADNDFQVEFEAAFPYEETPDQLRAIEAIKQDMERPRPMDRLLCGDVGFGKTEVAMRAAFKAVIGGRQCCLVCPTTILCEQHYENFTERFRRFPIKIAMVSRLVPKAEQKLIIEGLEKGEIDLLIGTHRALSKDFKFKQLGLLVIDEEQRFGVKHKERLKEVKHDIDSLAMSATPIPRTLHMSLVKIRDLSLLETPPTNRKPVETFIQEFNPDLVARAIRREVERGGQVFFLHNRVESLEKTTLFLQELIPEVMIEMAHGQMTPRTLEDIMHRFIHGGFQVLVSTTIVESGIDIPNVNTIIIDRADMYGISQLYQLRGRVGRSGRLAYAYMLYPQDRAMTELAMKRLKIISDFTELGSGFKIAMKDLEVRGAGNLLGSEQSGEILAVGFDMYIRLLSEAIEERQKREETVEQPPEVYLELDYSGFVPDTYITDPSEKMEVYKKISAVSTEEELDALSSELYDRFGPMPDELQSLLSLSEIRIICRRLWISSLKERKGIATVTFSRVAKISVDKLMGLIGTSGGSVKLNPARPDALMLETGKIGLKEKSEFIRDRLNQLL
ncbi:MAG: transcription-repair coupling factor [Spirochaetales bacterium]|nr:transcription-repair coupling factor [Spirochaetales bacterium]